MSDLRKTLCRPPNLTEMKRLGQGHLLTVVLTSRTIKQVANAYLLNSYPSRSSLEKVNKVCKDSERRVACHEQGLLVQAPIKHFPGTPE